jgi:hypothetical protein
MSAYALAKPMYEATRAVRQLVGQVGEVRKLLEDSDAPEEVQKEANELSTELSRLQRELATAGAGARGAFGIEGSTTRPTADQLWGLERSWEQVPSIIEKLNTMITDRVPALNRMLDEHGVRPKAPQTVTIPRKP